MKHYKINPFSIYISVASHKLQLGNMSKFVNGFHSQNVGSTWATSWRELNWILTDYEWCRFVIINTGNREMTTAVPRMSRLRQGWRSISIRQQDFSSFPRIRECLIMWFNVLALILVNVIQNNEKRILTHYIPIIYIVETLYNTIHFCWSTHKRHSIARPKGRGMGCLLGVQRATYCVDLSIWSSIRYLL